MRIKLHIQYEGSGFYGWQAQQDLPTVGGALLNAFNKLKVPLGEMVVAGRTDAGVHAWGQVVHADVAKPLEMDKFMGGLNRYLPHTVRVVRVAEVGDDFHARYQAITRCYRYLLWDARVLRPDLRGRVGHSVYALDTQKMKQAIEIMGVGEMDFSGFRDAECQSKSPVCVLREMKLVRGSNGLIQLEVAANRYLHHMVRNMVGVLVEVGNGKRAVDGMREVICLKDRKKAGMTFDAAGLYLARVDYAPHAEGAVAGELPLY
ncbi:MAG: tRNA pseudouridine(38-40) synthase TruA [Proteobacteria bacterium]|nr:tRNA pseudouridine(38-40) synthase TruA [Pseudomonadota bacterium]